MTRIQFPFSLELQIGGDTYFRKKGKCQNGIKSSHPSAVSEDSALYVVLHLPLIPGLVHLPSSPYLCLSLAC